MLREVKERKMSVGMPAFWPLAFCHCDDEMGWDRNGNGMRCNIGDKPAPVVVGGVEVVVVGPEGRLG